MRIVNRQTICNATVNQLSLESQVLDLWTEGEFLINCGENMLLAAIEKKYISIRAIGEMATQISISMDE